MAEAKRHGQENLIPQNRRTKEEQREIATMGGKASGEARRRKKEIREIYEKLLSMPATREMLATVSRSAEAAQEAAGGDLSAYEVIALAQMLRAARGDTAAAQFVRDSAGDKPTDKQEVTATVMTDADKALLERVAKRLGTE